MRSRSDSEKWAVKYGRIEDLDRSFDVDFWQGQGTAAIFAAAWELVEQAHKWKGKDLSELRLQRSVATLQRR